MLRRRIRPFVILLLGLTGAITHTPRAGAELFRNALSTRDFDYLPLYVGMRAGMFDQENLEVKWIQVDAGVVGSTELAASMVLQNSAMDPRKDVTFMNIGGAETSI